MNEIPEHREEPNFPNPFDGPKGEHVRERIELAKEWRRKRDELLEEERITMIDKDFPNPVDGDTRIPCLIVLAIAGAIAGLAVFGLLAWWLIP